MTIVSALFFLGLAILVHTYGVYLVVISLWARLRRDDRSVDDAYRPSVAMLVSAHNEAAVIGDKVRNFLQINYPDDRIELVVGTDGCDDGTDEVLQNLGVASLKVVRFPTRVGKATVLNRLVRETRADILVFSDANTIYDRDAVGRIVRHFADSRVGGVCGYLRLVGDARSVPAAGEIGYWEVENRLKSWESRIRTVFGATGGIYAIRRHLYKPLPTDRMVNDDFVVAMAVVEQGYRVVYEPQARAYEEAPRSLSREYARKVRIGAGNIYSMSRFARLLAPQNGFVAFGLFSHKYLRWLLPFLMPLLFLTNALLLDHGSFYQACLVVQASFYTFAILGWLLSLANREFRPFTYAFWFALLNLGLLIGAVRYILGLQKPTWETARVDSAMGGGA